MTIPKPDHIRHSWPVTLTSDLCPNPISLILISATFYPYVLFCLIFLTILLHVLRPDFDLHLRAHVSVSCSPCRPLPHSHILFPVYASFVSTLLGSLCINTPLVLHVYPQTNNWLNSAFSGKNPLLSFCPLSPLSSALSSVCDPYTGSLYCKWYSAQAETKVQYSGCTSLTHLCFMVL